MTEETNPRSHVSAPWTLAGNAWIVPQLHRIDQIAEHVPEGSRVVKLRNHTPGGYVCANYTSSPVGPYREIMFVPALLRHGRQLGFHVSHCYVDSTASIAGGRDNWWIPKQPARFTVKSDDQTVVFRAYNDTCLFATGMFTDREVIRIPFNNRWLPLALLQPNVGRLRRSMFLARGRLGLAAGVLDVLDATRLPRPSNVICFPIISVVQFRLVFEPGRTIAG